MCIKLVRLVRIRNIFLYCTFLGQMLVPIYLKLEKLSLTLDIHDGGSIRLFFLKKILYYQVFFVIKCKGKTYSMPFPLASSIVSPTSRWSNSRCDDFPNPDSMPFPLFPLFFFGRQPWIL